MYGDIPILKSADFVDKQNELPKFFVKIYLMDRTEEDMVTAYVCSESSHLSINQSLEVNYTISIVIGTTRYDFNFEIARYDNEFECWGYSKMFSFTSVITNTQACLQVIYRGQYYV